MALSKPTPLGPPEVLRSRACPAACGALIAARDTHPLCVMRLGLKHAQEAIDSPESCSHCLALPKKLSSGYAQPYAVLLEVCERAAARLNIEWPALQNPADEERDVYDGKFLGPPPGPRKQLFPVLPACAKHMKHHWKDPLDFKHGFSGLEVKDMAAHAMGEPPAVEPSIARHLNPTQGGLLAPPRPTLPNKMERFTASIHQASYRASSIAVRPLNVSSLLSAYQAELTEEMGKQLQKGDPSPILWQEIVTVNDLVLRNSRQCVQACGRSMALSVAGERALWLNLSGLPDSEKRRLAGAPVEPGRALFGPALTLMQQRCDDKKKEDEAFKLCLPRRGKPHLPPPMRPRQPPAVNRRVQPGQGRGKPQGRAPGQQGNPPLSLGGICGKETLSHPR
ncbi:hypothetical protein SKAU_G00093180 [Synaphobranchus kaupii]|uniref:Uncharacterized protein n=1 Tax=Synaphobranchus kaupii TaxID=118154 RepID=A0A9Q1FX33_SYNKA|nr:hypothetical protein SKAU_G00093180 [Synaphobranchus kaupii]